MYSEKNVINEEIKKNTSSEEEKYINKVQIEDELDKNSFYLLEIESSPSEKKEELKNLRLFNFLDMPGFKEDYKFRKS